MTANRILSAPSGPSADATQPSDRTDLAGDQSAEQVSLRVGDLGTLVDADGAQHGISFNPRLDRVFAAAPEMYAALCAVMSDTDDLDLDLIADLSPDTVKLINAALLKAEGRS